MWLLLCNFVLQYFIELPDRVAHDSLSETDIQVILCIFVLILTDYERVVTVYYGYLNFLVSYYVLFVF